MDPSVKVWMRKKSDLDMQRAVNATVLGQASGINSVFYTAGSCAVTVRLLQ